MTTKQKLTKTKRRTWQQDGK